MRIDVNAFIGSYPFRRVPGTSPEALLAAMDRIGLDQAWVTHLPGVFWRDPTEGNAWLVECARRQPRLRAVPAIHPGLATWRDTLRARRGCRRARRAGRSRRSTASILPAAPCAGSPLHAVRRASRSRWRSGSRTAASGTPTITPPSCPPAAVRALVRSDPRVRLLITHADRPFIEEVHFGSTPEEAARIWWDICWIWGPPEDHLQALLATVGPARFVLRHRAAAPASRERGRQAGSPRSRRLPTAPRSKEATPGAPTMTESGTSASTIA